MPLGKLSTSSPLDPLGRTHSDAQVSSPDTSPRLPRGGFTATDQQTLERPTRRTSLTLNPNSLVAKHVSTFSTSDANGPVSPPSTAVVRPLPLDNNRTSRYGDALSRNFTAPIPSPRSPPATASAPSSAVPGPMSPLPMSTNANASAPTTPAPLKRAVSSAGTATNRPSPRNGRFDQYRTSTADDKIGVVTNGRHMSSVIPGKPMNRSPSSMNLPRDVSKRRIPSPLPLSASPADIRQSIDSTSTLATPSPSMSSFGLQVVENQEAVDVPALIATAGSAEAAIHKLLLEKQTASSHNSQLWRLVEKQRAMILGLNRDLERALKDKERYRRKLKDHLVSSATLSTLHGEDSRPNLGDIDEGEPSHVLADSRMSSRQLTGPSPLSASTSMSLSLPMHSTPMRAPFANSKSEGTPPSLKSSNAVNTRAVTDGLPTDYSILEEQKALTDRKSPASLEVSPRMMEQPLISSPGLGPEVSDVYAPRLRGRDGDRGVDSPREEPQTHIQHARNPTPDSVSVQRSMSLDSGTISDVGSPHIAQVQTYESLNSVNAVMLDSTGSVQKQPDLVPVATSTEGSPWLLSQPSEQHAQTNSNIPRPLNITSKPTIPSPSATLFPRSPLAPPQSRYSPTSATYTTASSPQLPQPSASMVRSRSPNISERIVSAPNVIDHPSASQSGIIRSSDGIFRGFMSEHYAGMLLPPSALQSVHIKVDSARLRPLKMTHGVKLNDDHAVIVLAVCSRPDDICLWKVEKSVASVLYLDQQLRSLNTKLRSKMPDRNLFTGHAPARIDARRAALTTYFGQFLDMAMSDSASTVLAEFVSADAVGVDVERHMTDNASADHSGIRKDGYLTKKGKNFGGWKTRYFVVEKTVLNYYESPGGAHLGAIRLQSARIGRQTIPADMSDEEVDNQYRHAFMILEPKKQDPTSHLRHIFCAETDEERDTWVFTLQYSDLKQGEDKEITPVSISAKEVEPEYEPMRQPTSSPHNTVVRKGPKLQKSMGDVHRGSTAGARGAEGLQSKSSNALRAVGYAEVVAAEAPIIGPSISTSGDPLPNLSISSSIADTEESAPSAHPSISGPSNATVIHDSESWSSKPAKEPKERERKRSIFAFRSKSSTDTNAAVAASSQTPPAGPEKLRIVFGAPLIAACELASPKDVDVYLPAVLYRTMEFLHAKNALQEEGIFRMSGSSMAIKALRERFDNEGDVNLLTSTEDFQDVHTIASLLKLYLRELPANILTREAHGDFLKAADLEGDLRIQALNVLVNRLPRANREVLGQLSSFLKEIVDSEAINKMSVRNVGIVFAPTLNLPAPLISLFVTDHLVIFGPPLQLDLTSILAVPPTPTGNLSFFPQDIADPRTIVRSQTTGPPTSNHNFTSLTVTGGPTNATAATWEQQSLAAKEAFDTGYSKADHNTTNTSSTTTLTSARHALHASRSSGSIQTTLERSKTDSPLSSHLHRLSSAEREGSGLLNVSISQSPLLGAAEMKREKNPGEMSSSALRTAGRKSGQFLMNAGILDRVGGQNETTYRALRSWSSRGSMK